MSAGKRSFLARFPWPALWVLAAGCAGAPDPFDEDEDVEARAMRTEMLKHRGRVEPKGGIAIPMNSEFDVALPVGSDEMMLGVKGMFEAVQKGMWFGFEFNAIGMESKDPIPLSTPPPSESQLLAADTEQLMESHDRFTFMITWDYDIPTGDGLYYPIFRFGLGLGLVVIFPSEADGNTLLDFEEAYGFVARPTVGFRFPFHENFGAFVEANYDFIPEIQLTGRNEVTRSNVDIGDEVDFSSLNLWAGFSFEW